jgi:hypothetical protein
VRHKIIGGKNALKRIREYVQREMRITLTQQRLSVAEGKARAPEVTEFLLDIVSQNR